MPEPEDFFKGLEDNDPEKPEDGVVDNDDPQDDPEYLTDDDDDTEDDPQKDDPVEGNTPEPKKDDNSDEDNSYDLASLITGDIPTDGSVAPVEINGLDDAAYQALDAEGFKHLLVEIRNNAINEALRIMQERMDAFNKTDRSSRVSAATFYTKNPELVKYKAVVQTYTASVRKEMPKATAEEVLTEVAVRVKRDLNIPKQQAGQATGGKSGRPNAGKSNPPVLPNNRNSRPPKQGKGDPKPKTGFDAFIDGL